MSYNGENISFSAVDIISFPSNIQGNSPNIARLMRLIGDHIVIDWAKSYTMAVPNRIPTFFENIGFSYSDKRDWSQTTAENEIKNNRPVIIKAREEGLLGNFAQHIWVAEGFKYDPNSNYRWFYMNWGWRGSDNGWFASHQWYYDTGKKIIIVRD